MYSTHERDNNRVITIKRTSWKLVIEKMSIPFDSIKDDQLS